MRPFLTCVCLLQTLLYLAVAAPLSKDKTTGLKNADSRMEGENLPEEDATSILHLTPDSTEIDKSKDLKTNSASSLPAKISKYEKVPVKEGKNVMRGRKIKLKKEVRAKGLASKIGAVTQTVLTTIVDETTESTKIEETTTLPTTTNIVTDVALDEEEHSTGEVTEENPPKISEEIAEPLSEQPEDEATLKHNRLDDSDISESEKDKNKPPVNLEDDSNEDEESEEDELENGEMTNSDELKNQESENDELENEEMSNSDERENEESEKEEFRNKEISNNEELENEESEKKELENEEMDHSDELESEESDQDEDITEDKSNEDENRDKKSTEPEVGKDENLEEDGIKIMKSEEPVSVIELKSIGDENESVDSKKQEHEQEKKSGEEKGSEESSELIEVPEDDGSIETNKEEDNYYESRAYLDQLESEEDISDEHRNIEGAGYYGDGPRDENIRLPGLKYDGDGMLEEIGKSEEDGGRRDSKFARGFASKTSLDLFSQFLLSFVVSSLLTNLI